MSESYYESGPQSVSQIVISLCTGQQKVPCISLSLRPSDLFDHVVCYGCFDDSLIVLSQRETAPLRSAKEFHF